MVERWWEEAERNHVLPLDNRAFSDFVFDRPSAVPERATYVYWPGTRHGVGGSGGQHAQPRPRRSPRTSTATAKGVLALAGLAARRLDVLQTRVDALVRPQLRALAPVPRRRRGRARRRARTRSSSASSKTTATAATASCSSTAPSSARAAFKRVTPIRFSLTGAGLWCGRGGNLAVCDDYTGPFPWSGTLQRVVVEVEGPPDVDAAADGRSRARRPVGSEQPMDLAPTPAEDARCATRSGRGCAPTSRGSTARGCRRASTTSPTRSRSAGSGRRSSRAGGGSASAGPRSTAAAARARSSTTSSPRSSRAGARRSSSAASASTSSARRCSRTAPTTQKARWLPNILDASRDLVPAVQRARRGQRPDVAADARASRSTAAACSTARRCGRATRSSPTGAGASRAPNPDAPKTQGHLRARRRHARARRRGAAAAPDHRRVRVQRGVLHRRVRPRRPPRRPARRRLAHRELDAHPRAGRQPAPARRSTRSSSTSCGGSRTSAARSTTRASRRGSRRRSSRCACSSCTTGARSRAPPRARSPAPVGSINKLWWSEMSKRLHDTAMAVLGPERSRSGAAPTAIPGDGAWQRSWLYYQASSIWAGHQRDPAQRRRRAHPRPPPRTEAVTPGLPARLNRSALVSVSKA